MTTILRRLAPVAMVATFLGANALPAHAEAWPWQSPQRPNSTYHCGTSRTVDTQHGALTFQECVIVYRSPNGSWYQGLLSAYYTSTKSPARPEAFSGGQSVRLGGSEVDKNTCGTVTFPAREAKWCFSPTRYTRPGPLVSATGYISYAGVRYEVTAHASS